MPVVAAICGQANRSDFTQGGALSAGDQLLRAAGATTANIAEGYGRFHYLDNAKFCSNARGSCWETLDHLITGNDEGFIATELLNQGRMLVNEAVKILNGYMSYLKRAHRTRATTDNE